MSYDIQTFIVTFKPELSRLHNILHWTPLIEIPCVLLYCW